MTEFLSQFSDLFKSGLSGLLRSFFRTVRHFHTSFFGPKPKKKVNLLLNEGPGTVRPFTQQPPWCRTRASTGTSFSMNLDHSLDFCHIGNCFFDLAKNFLGMPWRRRDACERATRPSCARMDDDSKSAQPEPEPQPGPEPEPESAPEVLAGLAPGSLLHDGVSGRAAPTRPDTPRHAPELRRKGSVPSA